MGGSLSLFAAVLCNQWLLNSVGYASSEVGGQYIRGFRTWPVRSVGGSSCRRFFRELQQGVALHMGGTRRTKNTNSRA